MNKIFPRLLGVVLAFATLGLAPGCQTALPQTADLRQVHELYSSEFATLELPAPDAMTAAPRATGAAFARTLQAIHDYRARHRDDLAGLAHVQVLEGMIYLQSGRFGLAAAVRPEVEVAGERLAAPGGKLVRDRLLARHFGTLLEGWAETRKENNRQWRTFERVAATLADALAAIPAAQLAPGETDQAALHLATSAAVFWMWAAREIAMSPEREQAPAKRAAWFARARDTIGAHLTAAEKRAEAAPDLAVGAPGRLRYVEWYHWLGTAAR
jgi:hypothetical protein